MAAGRGRHRGLSQGPRRRKLQFGRHRCQRHLAPQADGPDLGAAQPFFIVTRQLVALGDAARRSCDACESFGAMVKKIIKHSTCRRRLKGEKTDHGVYAGSTKRRWQQTFKRGYIEQAFRRLSIRAGLLHGEENAPYLQRADASLLGSGRRDPGRKRVEGPTLLVRVKVEREIGWA